MGLSQGDREQRGYQALSRAAVTGISEELRTPGGQDDPQQQQQEAQMANSPACSINSGSWFIDFGFYAAAHFAVIQQISLPM